MRPRLCPDQTQLGIRDVRIACTTGVRVHGNFIISTENNWGEEVWVVVYDTYSEQKRAIPTTKTPTTQTATIFHNHAFISYGTTSHLMTDEGPQLARKYFTTLSSSLGLNKLATSAHNFQCNGHTERHKWMMVPRFRLYMAGHQCNWDLYMQPLTQVCKNPNVLSDKTVPIHSNSVARIALPTTLVRLMAVQTDVTADILQRNLNTKRFYHLREVKIS